MKNMVNISCRAFGWMFLLISLFVVAGCKSGGPVSQSNEQPVIFPDYTNVSVPCNIAPLNFKMRQECSSIQAIFCGDDGFSFKVKGKDYVDIPKKKWKKLLTSNVGRSITVTVSSNVDGRWTQYAPFSIEVSQYPIDETLVYRLIAPGYVTYSKMGIYQRNLTTFEQRPIIENTLLDNGCVNCHSFCGNNGAQMSFHIRGKKGGTILKNETSTELLNTKTDKTISNFVYPYWHPSGKYIAYSVNETNQIFHETMPKLVEVFDFASDLIVYDVENNRTLFSPLLMQESAFETFPAFSPDGRTLYFCTASQRNMPKEFQEVHYDLCSISFNPEDGTFGSNVDTLVHAAAMDKSISFPRPSPDGAFLIYTMSDYGNFSIWHHESDLFLLNLETLESASIDSVNSNDVDSYHSWSSNGRWFVFSSRRENGVYTMPFIALFDEGGVAHKPFLLPQKNPNDYEQSLFSFNVPELVKEGVDFDPREVEHLLNDGSMKNVGY